MGNIRVVLSWKLVRKGCPSSLSLTIHLQDKVAMSDSRELSHFCLKLI